MWVCRDWATLDIVLYGEDSAYEKFGKESGLMICSHRGDLDWVAGFVVGAYYKCLQVSVVCTTLLARYCHTIVCMGIDF